MTPATMILPQHNRPSEANLTTVVRSFAGVSRADTADVGGKGANLGELLRAGLPVPDGFIVAVDGYRRALAAAGLEVQVRTRANIAAAEQRMILAAARAAVKEAS